MAMLAEKRTKTKYYLHHKTLNPRGNAWCEDTSKFGQRILEKMGWTPGKGLGANESGSADPVHVSYKWDTKGMGFKGADGDEAVAQQKDFDALLATLSRQEGKDEPEVTTPIEKSTQSLELMSQKSRARVHYHKFTRGKDLSRASRKDLACILGIPMNSTPSAPAPTEPVIPDVGPPIEQIRQTTFGITTIRKGNSVDYFKQKFNERKIKLESSETRINAHQSENLGDVESSCGAFQDAEELLVESQGSGQSSEKSNKRKKKKRKNINVDCEESACVGNQDENQDKDNTTSSKGRRKSVTWGDVEVSFVSKYIKDMLDTSSDSLEKDVEIVHTEDCNETPALTKKKKKEKKQRKHESCLVDHSESNAANLNDSNEDTSIDHPNDANKKKKKKNSKTALFIEACNAEYAQELKTANDDRTGSIEKKKKKKNLESTKVHVEIQGVDDQSEREFEPSSSKKRNRKFKDVSNDTDNIAMAQTISEYELVNEEPVPTNEESRIISKKSKKRQIITVEGTVHDECRGETLTENRKKKRKLEEIEDEHVKICDPIPSPNEFPEEKKKKKKRKRDTEEREIQSAEEEGTLLSETTPGNKKMKGKKQEHESKCSLTEESSELALSALTQERIAKWKERRKSKDHKNLKVDGQCEASVREQKLSTKKLEYDPNRPTHDYNHKRVLTALGYNVKNAVDKKICVQMPPSNFAGSNLDEIPGYGQAIKSW